MLILAAALAGAAIPTDLTYDRLGQCLGAREASSTEGEARCYEVSRRAYQARVILALSALRRNLDTEAGAALDIEQKAWIAYRDARRDAMMAMLVMRTASRYALIKTYAPLKEADDMTVARDRALRLEAQLHILGVDP